MKVAIFENEYPQFKTLFDGFNLIYFGGKLDIKDFKSSQEFGDLLKLNGYNVLIVDIDLSIVSKMDGYQLITEVLRLQITNPKIMVLTGHNAMKEKLKEHHLPDYPIISKPLTLASIKAAFEYYNLI